jgi:hypothetical protein
MKAILKTIVWLSNPESRYPLLYTSNGDMSTEGWVKIAEINQVFELPSKAEMAPTYTAVCEKKIAKIYLKAAEEVVAVESTLKNFLALEDDSHV